MTTTVTITSRQRLPRHHLIACVVVAAAAVTVAATAGCASCRSSCRCALRAVLPSGIVTVVVIGVFRAVVIFACHCTTITVSAHNVRLAVADVTAVVVIVVVVMVGDDWFHFASGGQDIEECFPGNRFAKTKKKYELS